MLFCSCRCYDIYHNHHSQYSLLLARSCMTLVPCLSRRRLPHCKRRLPHSCCFPTSACTLQTNYCCDTLFLCLPFPSANNDGVELSSESKTPMPVVAAVQTTHLATSNATAQQHKQTTSETCVKGLVVQIVLPNTLCRGSFVYWLPPQPSCFVLAASSAAGCFLLAPFGWK